LQIELDEFTFSPIKSICVNKKLFQTAYQKNNLKMKRRLFFKKMQLSAAMDG